MSIKTDAPPSVIWDLLQGFVFLMLFVFLVFNEDMFHILGFAKKQFPNKTWPRPLPDKPLAIDYLLGFTLLHSLLLTTTILSYLLLL